MFNLINKTFQNIWGTPKTDTAQEENMITTKGLNAWQHLI